MKVPGTTDGDDLDPRSLVNESSVLVLGKITGSQKDPGVPTKLGA
jgi:hypothetical protein